MSLHAHPTADLLEELAGWSVSPVVSLFVPIDPTRRHLDRLELKAALSWAEHALVHEHRLRRSDAISMLAPVEAPNAVDPGAGSTEAWFLAPGQMVAVGLPEPVGPAVVIGESADTLALLPFLDDGPEYFALAFSTHRVRLFRADRYSIEQVHVPDLPTSIEDELWYVQREPTFSRHGSGVMHASGGGNLRHKDDVMRFAQLVDHALSPVLAGSRAPVVVMGVEYEASIMAAAVTAAPVVPTRVLGNPDALDPRTVHEYTYDLARSHLDPSVGVLATVRELAGTGRVVLGPDGVAVAAADGAIAQLVVSRDAARVPRAQGLLDPVRRTLGEALTAAVAAGADVYAVADDALPDNALAAAVLRY
ncbi:MAG: hypothetical protein ACO3C1_11035 [Ilumatobacteraceae bacterium]